MNVICSPQGIVDRKRPGQGILDIARAGFQDMLFDLSLYSLPMELEGIGKNQRESFPKPQNKVCEQPDLMTASTESILIHCKEQSLCTTVAYAPYLCWSTKRTDLNKLLVTLIQESIKTAGRAGCKYIIIRPLFAGIERKEAWSANRDYYLGFAAFAKENKLQILLENECRDINGHLIRGLCSDPEEAVEWIDQLNKEVGEEQFGFCMNVGVCNLCSQNMDEFLLVLGNRIKAVVLRDCNGNQETSMLPFTSVNQFRSKTDWLGLIRGLRRISFDGQIIMDFADTSAVFSPILRPQLMKLAYAIANYFKWQIEMELFLKKYSQIVLFGAGNMCRNYMKCYGQQYPPVFTCDNNQKLWGTKFCGLEVKPPASLKELPEDCAVFICNIYYREIEKQLRDMGIRNPIEFFNDEYMASFYFDRLEDR